jgi:hypothetical protein
MKSEAGTPSDFAEAPVGHRHACQEFTPIEIDP